MLDVVQAKQPPPLQEAGHHIFASGFQTTVGYLLSPVTSLLKLAHFVLMSALHYSTTCCTLELRIWLWLHDGSIDAKQPCTVPASMWWKLTAGCLSPLPLLTDPSIRYRGTLFALAHIATLPRETTPLAVKVGTSCFALSTDLMMSIPPFSPITWNRFGPPETERTSLTAACPPSRHPP